MRSSKSRSRSKQNRPRTLGNIINRVFDSSGPEGKVRGTPQQIIEKYQMLARDAQISNDRVAAENFLQHAEHYTRMLAEAQREMAAEQEARQQNQAALGKVVRYDMGQSSPEGLGEVQEMIDIHLMGTIFTNQAVFKYMRETGGSIVNHASIAGVEGQPNMPAYSAAF